MFDQHSPTLRAIGYPEAAVRAIEAYERARKESTQCSRTGLTVPVRQAARRSAARASAPMKPQRKSAGGARS